MTSRTAQPPTLRFPKIRAGHFRWWWPLVPIATIGALFVMLQLAASPAHTVKRVTIVNNTVYDIEVDVTGAGGGGTLSLGTAPARETTDVQDVIDQGPAWTLHFSAQGRDGGEQRIARADLDRADWRVVVPPDVAARLGAAGLQASPTPAN